MNTPSFQSWFSGSKIVDDRGQPLVVYHGTVADITAFDPGRLGQVTGAADARAGFFFAENASAADQFTWKDGEKVGAIYPTYLAIKNPVIIDDLHLDGSTGTAAGKRLQAAKEAGHDGAIFSKSDMLGHTGRVFVAFHPTQIKSSIGNQGSYLPNNPDIRFSQPSTAEASVAPQFELPLTPIAEAPLDLQERIRDLEVAGQAAGPFCVEAVALLEQLVPRAPSALSEERAEVYYSALVRGISDQLPRNKSGEVSPKAALHWIDARAREGRLFKTGEVEWSGVREWLQFLDRPVHVNRIVQFIVQHGVRVSETLLGGPTRHEMSERANAAGQTLSVAVRDGGGRAAIGSRLLFADELMWALLDGDVQVDELPPPLKKPAQDWVHAARAYDEFNVGNVAAPKYASHTLRYGEEYRELLLTLPALPFSTQGWTAEPYREGWYKVLDKHGNSIANMYGDTPDEAIEEARKYHESAPERRRLREYASNHWPGHPNVLCHIRFNTRPAPGGGKLLFVEEIQSDWQQTVRKEGVRVGLQEIAISDVTLEAETESAWILNDTKNKVSATIPKASYIGTGGLVRAIEDFTLSRIRAFETDLKLPPSGPFMVETKDWVSLAIKRIIRYAVDNDFTAVAFINGQQSADRNGVQAEVDKLILEPDPHSQQVRISARRRGCDAEDKFASCALDKLANYIGKDLADKVGSAPATRRVVLEGLDLEIGGHGMQKFYDEIVPQVANSLLKKLGCSKLSALSVKTREPFCSPGSIHIEAANRKFWLTQNDERRSADFDSYEEADQARLKVYQDEESGATPQLGFVITEELRSQVAQGLPLFSRQAPGADAPTSMSALGLSAVSMLARFFETPVAVLRTTDTSAFQFNGALHGQMLYLNERTTRPLHTVFGHELVHKMRLERPDLYDTLAGALDPLIQNEARYAAQAGLFFKPTPFVREELIADIVGDRFAEHGFWKMVARHAKDRFSEMTDFVTRTINDLMHFLPQVTTRTRENEQSPAGTAEFIRDLGKARKAIADVLLTYAQWAKAQSGRRIFSDDVAHALQNSYPGTKSASATPNRPKARI